MSEIPNKHGIPEWDFRVVIGSTKIDYDPKKDEGNKKKHGYSLKETVEQLTHLIIPVGKHRPYMVSEGFQEREEIRHMHMGTDEVNSSSFGKVLFFGGYS